jgi:formylglycine-generating enzyme required for sulfatase activity
MPTCRPSPRLSVAALALRAAVAVAALVIVGAAGCEAERVPAPGQLTVVLRTNMTPGKDFDLLRFSVGRVGAASQFRDFRWTARADRIDGEMKFPSTVSVLGPAGEPIAIRVEASRRGDVRLVREARLAVPSSGNLALPMLLDWSCLDLLPRGALDAGVDGGAGAGVCDEGASCVDGECQSSVVAGGSLRSYDSASVFPDAGPGGSACFDVLAAFERASTVTPSLVDGVCGVPAPASLDRLNVAVALGPSSEGICSSNACLVPLDRDEPSGWRVQGAGTPAARIVVPRPVCARGRPLALAVGAPSKTSVTPVCGSWSSVGPGVDAPAGTVIVLDPIGGVDAGLLDASIADVTVAPPEADASLVDVVSPDAGLAADATIPAQDAALPLDASAPDAGAPVDASVDAEELSATSSAFTGPGLSDCGPSGSENCARSPFLHGGTVFRGSDQANPATISPFRLDRFEVTVGRFRKFVEAWNGALGARGFPVRGGVHGHVSGGTGLVAPGGRRELGWDAAWTSFVGAPSFSGLAPSGAGARDANAWAASFATCRSGAPTWQSAPSAADRLPINCVSWYDAQAFCQWDGGFLPSEAEWEYAAAGGDNDRPYPWGWDALDATRAVYNRAAPQPVGGVPAGDGLFGHADLAGNVAEMVLDWYASTTYVTPCTDCWNPTALASGLYRGNRGSSFLDANGFYLDSYARSGLPPSDRHAGTGFRCARPKSCTPLPDATYCERAGATCGALTVTDNCGKVRTIASCGACAGGASCTKNACAPELTAVTASLAGYGLDDCGGFGHDSCARSLVVPSGAFFRDSGTSLPATVSSVRVDKYEVTVGRFRRFVTEWIGGWRPAAGAGRHTHLGPSGVVAATGSEGWNAGWSSKVGAPAMAQAPTSATTLQDWTNALACSGAFATWSPTAGVGDRRPQNCLNWYDLAAFCVWDGGFLPTRSEWEYAASGGAEERIYPWGFAAPPRDAALAVHDCAYEPQGTCTGVASIPFAGSVAQGIARWGQHDFAGSLLEWVLDASAATVPLPCADCANLDYAASTQRVLLGSGFSSASSALPVYLPGKGEALARKENHGGRCARAP